MDLDIWFFPLDELEELVGVVFELLTRIDVVVEHGADKFDVFGAEAAGFTWCQL